jgi:hypothetical protein
MRLAEVVGGWVRSDSVVNGVADRGTRLAAAFNSGRLWDVIDRFCVEALEETPINGCTVVDWEDG